VEWQRRIFKKIGEYLRKHNLTIHKCFNLIDEDNSQTISIDELRNAIIRFQMDITDKELKVFLTKLDEEGKGYITQQ
jgi:Ca2+-binding EF-hand superfamily protein